MKKGGEDAMVKVFAKRMTELRRKKGITQKQAALSLGISQALLSHYENGVRECGLDFLVKAAKFYDVSCDYLLGREKKEKAVVTLATKEKQRLRAADYILFDLLDKCGSSQLVEQATDFLALAYYRLYRRIYCGGHAQPGEFHVPDYTYRALADAAMQVSEAQIRCVLDGMELEGLEAVDAAPLMIDQATMAQVYGNDYILLTQLLEKAEHQCKV